MMFAAGHTVSPYASFTSPLLTVDEHPSIEIQEACYFFWDVGPFILLLLFGRDPFHIDRPAR